MNKIRCTYVIGGKTMTHEKEVVERNDLLENDLLEEECLRNQSSERSLSVRFFCCCDIQEEEIRKNNNPSAGLKECISHPALLPKPFLSPD